MIKYRVLLSLVFLFLFNQTYFAQWIKTGGDNITVKKIEYYKGHYYLATIQKGVMFSYDGGKSWSEYNRGMMWYAILKQFDDVYAMEEAIYCTGSSGIYILNEQTRSWENRYDTAATSIGGKGNLMFAGVSGNGLIRSTDAGLTWKRDYPNTAEIWHAHTILFIEDTIFVGASNGIFKSMDEGISWVKIDSPRNFCLSYHNGNIYASKLDGLFYSSDFGRSWITTGLNVTFTRDIEFYGDEMFSGSDRNINYKNSRLNSWVPAGWGIDEPLSTHVNCLFIKGDTIYAGTNDGIWKRDLKEFRKPAVRVPEDFVHNPVKVGDDSWLGFGVGNIGGDTLYITDVLSSNDDFIIHEKEFVLIPNGGWYIGINYHPSDPGKSETEITVISNDTINKNTFKISAEVIPIDYGLQQNYPNPFNPSTTIEYSLAKTSNVILNVYNVLGQRGREIVNEVQGGGKYSIKFDANELSSGVYFYTLITDNYKATKKFMIMK